MIIWKRTAQSVVFSLITAALLVVFSAKAQAQAASTADQPLALSAFGGVTGTFTGISPDTGPSSGQAKNLGITAGVDLRISHFGKFLPSAEVRGTFPIHKGSIASEKLVLGGIKVERPILSGRIHPYADILYGRGEIDYQDNGYYVPASSLIYYYTVSNVFSPGAGVDFDVTHSFALKLDAQFEHFNTPINTSGAVYSKALTAAVVYNFDFNHHLKQPRDR